MKKTIITLAIVLLAVVAQAQTALKVHNNGQISLQSATTAYGIQIPSSGVVSFEPNITSAYSITNITKARAPLTRAWTVNNLNGVSIVDYQFFVLGNGSVYSSNGYYNYTSPFYPSKNNLPIEGATELIANMRGYYMESHEYDGVTQEAQGFGERQSHRDVRRGIGGSVARGRTPRPRRQHGHQLQRHRPCPHRSLQGTTDTN